MLFPEAWDESPRRSRLVHGVGIMSLGTLMDEMSWNLSGSQIPTAEEFAGELQLIADQCHWMGGSWKFGSGAPLEGATCRTHQKILSASQTTCLTSIERLGRRRLGKCSAA